MPATSSELNSALEDMYAAYASGSMTLWRSAMEDIERRFPDSPEAIAFRLDRVFKSDGDEAGMAEIENLSPEVTQEPPIRILIARRHCKQKNFDEGVAVIQEALNRNPDNRMLLRNAALIFRATKNSALEVEVVRHWLAVRPNDPMASDAWANYLFRTRAIDELRSFLERAPFAYVKSYLYKLILWKIALYETDTAGMVIHAEEAVRLAPESSKAASHLAHSLYHVRRLDEAERHAKRALELEPSNRSAQMTLYRVSEKRGDSPDSRPPKPFLHDERPEFSELNEFDAALDLYGKGDADKARSAMRDVEDSVSDVRLKLATMKTRLPGLIHKRNQEELRRVLEALQAHEPNGADTYLARWAVEYFWGRAAEALRVIQAGTAAHPHAIRLRARLMVSLHRTPTKAGFYRLASDFIKSPPNTPGDCASVYVALIHCQRRDLADQFLKKLEAKFPDEKWIKESRVKLDDSLKEYWSKGKFRKRLASGLQWMSDRLSLSQV